MEPKYSQCCNCWNGVCVLRHINCRQNLVCLSWLLVQAVVCKPCLCSQSRCGSKAVTQQILLCSSSPLFVTEAEDLAQEEVLHSLDHILREESEGVVWMVLDFCYSHCQSYCIPFKPIGLYVPWQELFFSGKRKFSRLHNGSVRQRSLETTPGQGREC